MRLWALSILLLAQLRPRESCFPLQWCRTQRFHSQKSSNSCAPAISAGHCKAPSALPRLFIWQKAAFSGTTLRGIGSDCAATPVGQILNSRSVSVLGLFRTLSTVYLNKWHARDRLQGRAETVSALSLNNRWNHSVLTLTEGFLVLS